MGRIAAIARCGLLRQTE